jgi:SNF2 family DNA or RNA helicase
MGRGQEKDGRNMIFTPHPYQSYCINRGITDPELGLFLDMGLGKTVIVETIINELRRNRYLINKPLIIAPKKVAQATWTKEAAKWDHLKQLRLSVALGTETQRLKALCTPADAYIINRENVPWLVERYRNAWPFDMVVADESSSFKNHEAKRFKALTWVRPHIKRFIDLSGTPTPKGLIDLWSQVYLLDQGKRLYDKIGKYREVFFNRGYGEGGVVRGYEIKADAEKHIYDRIRDICISMDAKDYLDLPDLIVDDIPVYLEPRSRAMYDELERKAVLEVAGQRVDAGTAAVLTNKLLQLCNGAVYDGDGRVMQVHDDKIEAFMETVEQLNGKPALVFYNFKHDLTRLLRALMPTGLRVRLLQTSADEDAWNRGEVDIMLAHPASSAYGLNLQDGGNHIIWFALNWSLELYQQAIKRLHRQGQLEKVIVHRLVVMGGVDEDVVDALENKAGTQDRLLKAIKARIEKVRAA